MYYKMLFSRIYFIFCMIVYLKIKRLENSFNISNYHKLNSNR